MKVLLAPDKFKGSLTAAEVVQHLGNGLHRTRHPVHRAAARRRRGRQRPGRHRSRVPPDPHHRRRGHRPRAPHHRRVRRHHRRHRGRQHLRPAHPARREARPAGSHQQRSRRRPSSRCCGATPAGSSWPSAGPPAPTAAPACSPRSVPSSSTTAGQPSDINGGTLQRIRSIDTTDLADLSGVEIVIASDVQNPLTGPDGAAAVYGPQKGATAELVTVLDAGLAHLVHQLTLAGNAERRTVRRHPRRRRRRRPRLRRDAARRPHRLRRRLLPRPAGLRNPPAGLRSRHHRRRPDGRPNPERQTPRDHRQTRRADHRSSPSSAAATSAPPHCSEMGIQAVHAIADHTDGNPAGDPALSGQAAGRPRPDHPTPR